MISTTLTAREARWRFTGVFDLSCLWDSYIRADDVATTFPGNKKYLANITLDVAFYLIALGH